MHPRSIVGFLASARKALTAPKGSRQAPLTLVIGNEAADLDSFCSAFLYAYLRSHTPPHYRLHIPLVNVPRADLALRKDVDAGFAASSSSSDDGVSRLDMICLSDVPDDLAPEDTRWVLVDHNEMTGDLGKRFGSRVVGCVDHHADEGVVPRDVGEGEPRIIRPCGSAVTLVVEYCRATWDAVTAAAEKESEVRAGKEVKEDGYPVSQLARIVLGPIMLDTGCLKSRSKTTASDLGVTALAESVLQARPEGKGYDREGYYAELIRLKEDIEGFSYRDVLRKDYKEWTSPAQEGDAVLRLGMSSSSQPLSRLFETIGPKEELLAETRKWAQERELDVVSIMTLTQREDGGLSRELLVWALSGRAVAVAKAFLEGWAEELQLEEWEGGALDDVEAEAERGEWRMCWHQRNEEHSRKQVAPMLREAMKQASSARL